MAPKGDKHDRKGKVIDRGPASHDTDPADLMSQQQGLSNLPLHFQQSLLNVFRDALPLPTNIIQIRQLIQEVKGHLYSRDFAIAFGSQDYLYAYALRWSAARVLAYADIFSQLDVKAKLSEISNERDRNKSDKAHDASILCVGGGSGAEIVALAAVIEMSSLPLINITVVDVADWSEVLIKLRTAITEAPVLSPYASAATKDSAQPLLDSSRLHVRFEQQDILECDDDQLKLLVADASLVTILFTLNELFSKSISSTTTFLLKLTNFIKPDAWLVVVDSPGSYAEVTLGKDGKAKQYPMRWLLDHILLEVAGKDSTGNAKWAKRIDLDSKWFRINKTLKYPIDLESMRYQLHFYQRYRSNHVSTN